MRLFDFLIDLEFVLNGSGILSWIRLKDNGFAPLKGDCSLDDLAMLFFDGVDGFIFVLDHLCGMRLTIKLTWG